MIINWLLIGIRPPNPGSRIIWTREAVPPGPLALAEGQPPPGPISAHG